MRSRRISRSDWKEENKGSRRNKKETRRLKKRKQAREIEWKINRKRENKFQKSKRLKKLSIKCPQLNHVTKRVHAKNIFEEKVFLDMFQISKRLILVICDIRQPWRGEDDINLMHLVVSLSQITSFHSEVLLSQNIFDSS